MDKDRKIALCIRQKILTRYQNKLIDKSTMAILITNIALH